MNKYQKALDYIVSNGTHETIHSLVYVGDEIEVETEHGEESLNLLQELVDRETPMKVITFEAGSHECPKCHTSPSVIGAIRKHYKTFAHYCHNCGQKLDWSNNNE